MAKGLYLGDPTTGLAKRVKKMCLGDPLTGVARNIKKVYIGDPNTGVARLCWQDYVASQYMVGYGTGTWAIAMRSNAPSTIVNTETSYSANANGVYFKGNIFIPLNTGSYSVRRMHVDPSTLKVYEYPVSGPDCMFVKIAGGKLILFYSRTNRNQILVSEDGVNVTTYAALDNYTFYDVAYVNGVYCFSCQSILDYSFSIMCTKDFINYKVTPLAGTVAGITSRVFLAKVVSDRIYLFASTSDSSGSGFNVGYIKVDDNMNVTYTRVFSEPSIWLTSPPQVVNGRVYLSGGTGGGAWLDVSNPDVPTLKRYVPTGYPNYVDTISVVAYNETTKKYYAVGGSTSVSGNTLVSSDDGINWVNEVPDVYTGTKTFVCDSTEV